MTKSWYRDTVERVLWTFIQGFLAEWAITQSLNEQTFKIAAAAGAVSAVKCVLATQVGSPKTAATLPEEDDTPNE